MTEVLIKNVNHQFIISARNQAKLNINRLLFEREGRGTTEGWYSPVRLKQARLVSCLLYGTLWCLFQILHQKFPDLQDNKTRLENVRLLYPCFKFRKNFNLFSFFWQFHFEEWQYSQFFFSRWFGSKFWICQLRPKEKYTGWTVFMETVRTAKFSPRKIQSEHRDLPNNKDWVCHVSTIKLKLFTKFFIIFIFIVSLKFHPAKENPLVFTASLPYHITDSSSLNCNVPVSETHNL